MTILDAPWSVALDEGEQEFISTFMTHVAAVSGYGTNRLAAIAHIKTLLLAAIARGDGASSTAWRTLHHALADLVATVDAEHHARDAHDFLRSFLQENGDLADD